MASVVGDGRRTKSPLHTPQGSAAAPMSPKTSLQGGHEISRIQRLSLSLGSLPTNLGWAISEALIIPYLLETGCPMYACSWAWFLSPILSNQLGPSIDHWTDSLHEPNCFGWRGRKQLILLFSFLSLLLMFCIPRSEWISINIFNTDSLAMILTLIFLFFIIMDLCNYLILRILSSLIWIVTMGNTQLYIQVMRTYNVIQVICRMLGCVITAISLEWQIFNTNIMNHITTAFTLGSITILISLIIFLFLAPNPPDLMFDDLQQANANARALGGVYVDDDDDDQDNEMDPLTKREESNSHENDNNGMTPFETATRSAGGHGHGHGHGHSHSHGHSHGAGWHTSEMSDREAADQRIMASIGDMSREEIEMNKVGYYWLILTQFCGWVTISCVVIFWTSFTGIDIYDGDPTASYDSTALTDFENGINFGVFGLLIKAVVSVNTSLAYPWFTNCFSIRSLFLFGEFIMSIVCILVFFVESEVALLILIAIFGFAMQLHLQTCPDFTDHEFRPLYDTIMKQESSWIKYFLENSLVIAPVTVALFGGPIADAINDEFRWIFFIPGIIMFFMNFVLSLAFLNLLPGIKLPPPKQIHNSDLYEQETYLP